MPKFLMFARNPLILATFFFLPLFLSSQPALAGQNAEFYLHSFDYQCMENCIKIEASLGLTDNQALQTALTGGAVIDLAIRADLQRTRFLLPNTNLASTQINWQIRYDALARDFVLLSPDGDSARFRALNTLFSTVLSMLTLTLPLEQPLPASNKYRLTLGLSLRQANMPDWLERGLLFWQWEETPPVTFNFDLAPDCACLE